MKQPANQPIKQPTNQTNKHATKQTKNKQTEQKQKQRSESSRWQEAVRVQPQITLMRVCECLRGGSKRSDDPVLTMLYVLAGRGNAGVVGADE